VNNNFVVKLLFTQSAPREVTFASCAQHGFGNFASHVRLSREVAFASHAHFIRWLPRDHFYGGGRSHANQDLPVAFTPLGNQLLLCPPLDA